MIAEEGIRSLARALPLLAKEPDNARGRHDALYGAYLAGTSIDQAGVALHHKLCHVLGGFGLNHAHTHTVLLPHVCLYNREAAPEDFHPQVERCLDLLGRMNVPVVGVEGVEADDVIATLVKRLRAQREFPLELAADAPA